MAQMNLRTYLLPIAVALALQWHAGAAVAQEGGDLAQQAREAAWAGHTAEALQLLDRYLQAHPGDRAAQLDRVRYLSWQGDYARAIADLDALGGDDAESTALRARVLAWAGRRHEALALNTPLYAANPNDYDLAYTQAVASRIGQQPREAMAALARAQALKPGAKDTLDLAKGTRLPLYSSVSAPLSRYSDSDDIEILSRGVEADVRVADDISLLGSFVRRRHSAPATGPFAPITGGGSIDEDRAQLGVRYAFSPYTAIEAEAGRSRLDGQNGGGGSRMIGHLDLVGEASDAWAYRLGVERDRVINSPRSVSLDIATTEARADVTWRPTLRDTVQARVAAAEFSDGNHRNAVSADARHALVRTGHLMLDAGLQGEWQDYSRDPGNGYYAPSNYRRIAPILGAYVGLGDEVGLSITTALGVQRDGSFDGWRRASDVGVALTVGIFTPWQLTASASYSERLNQIGQYDGLNVSVELRYRFCAHQPGRCP